MYSIGKESKSRKDQSVTLALLELIPMIAVLGSILMDLQDSALLSLLKDSITNKEELVFEDLE